MKSENGSSLAGGRHRLRSVGLVIGLVVMLLLWGWWPYPANATGEAPSTHGVSIEVSFEGLEVVANSAAPIRVEVDQAATVTVSILETSQPSAVIDDPSMLFEIEQSTGSRTRFTDLDRLSDTEYRADFTFSETGTWRFVALPDMEDRSLLPPGSTDVVVVIVEETLAQAPQVAGNFGLLFLGGLVLAMVALVSYFTRHKLPWDHRPKTPSASHDTWWNSP